MTNVDMPADPLSILVVEDEPLVRALFVETLRMHGNTVSEAATADRAVEIAEEADELDVVVADILLPRSSGFELALQVRRLHPAVGLVFVTGWMPDEIEAPPEIRQPYKLLRKPLGAQDLLDAVAAVIGQRALR
jgi:two-component system, cell cycle sensor histidine kinase and response regulator CckA